MDGLKYLEIGLTEHCNLNCKGCSHFSPLAQPGFLDLQVFERDIQRISQLFAGNIACLRLMGGEPLLHPQLAQILKVARTHCPHTRILLVTNGTLLGKMEEAFWESCIANQITIHITKYPLPFDYDKHIQQARDRGATVSISAHSVNTEKTFHHLVLVPEGGQDAQQNFETYCTCSTCTNLSEGKLYMCPISACVKYFNQYFGKQLPVTEGDYVDIHAKGLQAQDILEFLSKPVPFCQYCQCKSITYGHKWESSQKQITEWT